MPTTKPGTAGLVRAILVGGTLAGVFDAAYATFWLHFRGRSFVWMAQSIASGILGRAAFEGGAGAAAIGLLAHFVIAFGAAATYALASRRLPVLARRPVPCGMAFGIAVYLFMNFGVLPMSRIPWQQSFPPSVLARGLFVHVFLVGPPIALAVRRYAPIDPSS